MEFDILVFEKIKDLITNNKTFTITTHINPDGDAIGSTLALYGILKQLGKDVKVVIPNNCPDYLHWIEGFESIIIFDKMKQQALDFFNKTDVFFCLDYNNLSRIEIMGEAIKSIQKTHILIDHHPNPECFADVAISKTESSSTAELVYHTIIGCGYQQYITKEIAEALHTGIITDTGGLSHNSSRPQLYYVVADLLTKGVDKSFINDKLFNVFSFSRMQLLGTILKDNFVYIPEYKTGYMFITLENQKKFDFQLGDTEGFVNYPLSVKDIQFCALFTEYEKNMTKISFRSKGKFPANQFSAKFFNGGGHLNAAGGRINLNLLDSIAIFEKGLASFKELLLIN